VAEAIEAGRLMRDAGLAPEVVHTSVLVRSIETADLALGEMGLTWIPVRRSWRLNERHYGALQGLNKKETAERFGQDKVKVWRRSYDVRPPDLDASDERHPSHDPRYASLPPELLPSAECLKDVVERMLPYWFDAIVPDLLAHSCVLVSAHGNSLRALVKHLDGLSDQQVVELDIPTGVPRVYELGSDFRPKAWRYLGDPDEIARRADAVRAQAGGRESPSP
jgi:2,3-bisphosphoglycerate-dependent phosphoglycerate mutase